MLSQAMVLVCTGLGDKAMAIITSTSIRHIVHMVHIVLNDERYPPPPFPVFYWPKINISILDCMWSKQQQYSKLAKEIVRLRLFQSQKVIGSCSCGLLNRLAAKTTVEPYLFTHASTRHAPKSREFQLVL